VVKTGAIALVVEDDRVTPILTEVQALATAVGGVVADAKTQELGPTPAGTVTLRVPVARFEEVVAKVRALDAEVRSATTSGQDVTAQYADLEAQLRTLTAARERFLEILSRARTIGDVLAVQQRVDDVTGKLDRLEGQRRVLADQSDKATLQISVTEEDDVVVAEAEPDTAGKAVRRRVDGFTDGVEGLIRLSGRGGCCCCSCLGVLALVLRLGLASVPAAPGLTTRLPLRGQAHRGHGRDLRPRAPRSPVGGQRGRRGLLARRGRLRADRHPVAEVAP
jgi:hypothetical protein